MAEIKGAGPLPSGVVTFVFTDIEGSTRLFRSLNEAAIPVFEKHNELMRSAWAAHGGHEVSTEGDSFFVAFDETNAALAACADAQRRLAAADWPDGVQLRVRMGIHAGLAAPRNNNYVALAVHRAARVMAAGHGGQIIVTSPTARRAQAPTGSQFTDIGQYRLRDFDEPPALLRLDVDGTPVNDDPIRATPADRHNLVRAMTSFVGRDADALAITSLLVPGKVITVAGPGGVGKTRLAAEIGMVVASDWADGVWMVELAEIFDSELLVEEIATALGASTVNPQSRWADVLDHLANRRSLIILDNIEQHIETCAELVPDILSHCPGVSVLATGREQMNIAGEQVYRLSSLAVTGAGGAATTAAVQLFVDRAKAAKPDFVLEPAIVDEVAGVCTRLDGLPLAIEIAAAQLAMLSVSEILAGLSNRFRLLQSRDRSLPARQRTMEGLLGWSYQLLNDDERAALRRLAVFAGGFTVEAALAALAGPGTSAPITAADGPELLWALIDKSLIAVDRTESATRYRLPESVQDYAMRLLVDTDDPAAVAIALGEFFLDRVGPWNVANRGWIGEVGMELPNLRGVVDLAADAAPELAQQIVCTIGRYHDAVQSFYTGVEELTRAAVDLVDRTPARVAMLASLADLHLRQANIGAAQELLDSARELEADVGPPEWNDAAIPRTQGELANRAGDFDAAVHIAEAALNSSLSKHGQARMWNQLGIARHAKGDPENARTAFEHELDLYVSLNYEAPVASAHANLAETAWQLGDRQGTAMHQKACLDDALAIGQPVMIAYSLIVASRLAVEDGNAALAVRLETAASSILSSTGHELYEADQAVIDATRKAAQLAIGAEAMAEEVAKGLQLSMMEASMLAAEVLREASEETLSKVKTNTGH